MRSIYAVWMSVRNLFNVFTNCFQYIFSSLAATCTQTPAHTCANWNDFSFCIKKYSFRWGNPIAGFFCCCHFLNSPLTPLTLTAMPIWPNSYFISIRNTHPTVLSSMSWQEFTFFSHLLIHSSRSACDYS